MKSTSCQVEMHKIVVTYRYDPVSDGKSDPRTNVRVFDTECIHTDGEQRIRDLCRNAVEWIDGQEEWCRDRCESQIVPGFYPEYQFLSATLDGQPITLPDLRRRAAGQWWW